MIYLSNYFINLSKIHLEPCSCAFVFIRQHIFHMVFIFCLALAIADLLGVGWRGGFSSHSFLMCPSRLAYAHFWDRLVLQGASSNTLALCKYLEGSSLYFRVPLLSSVSDLFEGGSKVVSNISARLRVIWLVCSILYYWGSPILSLVCCIYLLFSSAYVGALRPRLVLRNFGLF